MSKINFFVLSCVNVTLKQFAFSVSSSPFLPRLVAMTAG